jgi:hypothetical protein
VKPWYTFASQFPPGGYVKHHVRFALATLALALVAADVSAQPPSEPAGPFDRLRFREIGPAAMAGRIDDFAVLESNPAVFYVATARSSRSTSSSAARRKR